MNSDSPLIEIIPLSNAPVQAGCITPKTRDIITQYLSQKKKVLLFYNRRGTARAWICQDCGHFSKCPHCDIALTYHTEPSRRLMCHHCNFIDEAPIQCPHCQGNHFVSFGVGTEYLAQTLSSLLPQNTRVLILDSDHRAPLKDIHTALDQHEVILATQMGMFLSHPDIGAIMMLLFEIDLSLPEYDLEESLYAQIAYHKKRRLPLYIQTYIPEHPLLQSAVFGNYRSYMQMLSVERREFFYPPYSDFVTLRIVHRDQHALTRLRDGLVERILPLLWSEVFCAWDRDIVDRFRGEYMQKIILKWRWVADIIESLEPVLLRSRAIYVDWH